MMYHNTLCKDAIRVSVVGDMMPSGILYGKTDGFASERILAKLAEADVRIGNLECAIGPYQDSPHFDPEKMKRKMDVVWAIDEDLDRIVHMGFDVLCLSNNHIWDLAEQGFDYTLKQLEKRGISYCGAGYNIKEASRPAVITVRNKTIAVLSLCDYRDETVGYVPFATETTGGVCPLYPLDISCSLIARCKKQYDYVIVVPHWGREHTWWATKDVLRDSRKLVDAGADAVLGGHPHRVWSSFCYKGKPVFPSLGNFFFPDRYLNKPRPTWYPPKGTDTSLYPRMYGYPWVEEPTLKLWQPKARIGMIAELRMDHDNIVGGVIFTIMDANGHLDLVLDLRRHFTIKDRLILTFTKRVYIYPKLYAVILLGLRIKGWISKMIK